VTVADAAKTTPSPGWLAWIVHVPLASSVAAENDTVQIVGVVEPKPTGSPELAVAINATGTDVLIACVGIAAKVIVCGARLTVKLCMAGVAAA
jgi:hypothetical protein